MLAPGPAVADTIASPRISQELVEQLRAKLVRYLSKHLHQQEAVEDVAHEALLSYLASPAQFHGRSALSTYLIAIARNKLADLLRDRYREEPLPEFDEIPAEQQTLQESTLERNAVWDALMAELRKLPSRQREAFYRSVVRDEDSRLIARDLGITVNHLGVLVFRARLKLRESPTLGAAADALLRSP